MTTTVFDIETDGLLDELTKIHVLSYMGTDGLVHHTHDYDDMRTFFAETDVIVGHSIVRFDVPAVEKVLGIKVKSRLIDTLALSWYLNHGRLLHGLASYGEEYGVPKPVVDDWHNLSPEEYAHRCDEDVKINVRLWRDLQIKLNKLYGNINDSDRMIDYLTFKMKCAQKQEELQWKLDVPKAQAAHDELAELKLAKVEQLAEAMPKHMLTKVVKRPKGEQVKKDGSCGHYWGLWLGLCHQHKQETTALSFVVPDGEERGNPNSPLQVKDWLYSLGWEPRTHKFDRHKVTGEERLIPQIRKGSDLCDSVLELDDRDPAVVILDGLTVLTHRLGILKSFLSCHVDGYLKAEVSGLTNTMRFKHSKPLVNLPAVDKPYGEMIRGCLTCPDGYTLVGADMVSLEDTTKRHYMKPHDPSYVEDMSREGFDPHLDLALHAGVISQVDIDHHNTGVRSLKSLRKNYKVVNYSATYGVGPPTLARTTGMSQKEAKVLLEAFWSRNWSIEKVAKQTKTKELFNGMWLYNPVSKFWYSLRSDKDRFSTLNQGTGVFCFDTWVGECVKRGVQVIGQFHDEIISPTKLGEEEATGVILEDAMVITNERLGLNVPLGVDYSFGKTYAEIH